MRAEILANRTKQFAIKIIRLCRLFPVNDETRIVKRQLIRSSTSVAANYRAACRARFKAEFIAKLCIVIEEADESLSWLEILEESGLFSSSELVNLKSEALELVKIFASGRKTANQNRKV